MRMYGAEKLQWFEVKDKVGAERAGYFVEWQLRLGLNVDGATPKTCDARRELGASARSTRTDTQTRFSQWCDGLQYPHHGGD